MRRIVVALKIIPVLSLLGLAPPNATTHLDQGWTTADTELYWNSPQGSRIIPYPWFAALERTGSQTLLSDAANLASYGFLPGPKDTINPDGLPIGLSREQDRSGSLWLGMTCAACHTGTITHAGKTVLIEGAGAMLDQRRFDADLSAALVATADEDARFARFADRLSTPAADRDALRAELRTVATSRAAFTAMNKVASEHGPGRVDALGVIMNALTDSALSDPTNARPPDAPVRLPWIWNSPRYSRVQYNGSISNAGLGPLLRNIGQTLGVYGTVDLSKPGMTYPSSVSIADLDALEALVTKLKPPAWPADVLGPIDTAKAERGADVFKQTCAGCHAVHDPDANGLIPVPQIPLEKIGTDPRAARNFMTRPAKTDALEGRPIAVFAGPVFGPQAGAATIVGHVSTAVAAQVPRDRLQAGMGAYRAAIAATPVPLGGYKAIPLSGVWAGAPYLHNGSVANLHELLTPPADRAPKFTVGGRDFDPALVGFPADVTGTGYVLDTTLPGNSNAGHEFGTTLPDDQKSDLIEYLKTL